MIKYWLGLHDVHSSDWSQNGTKKTQSRRPLASLMLLVSWELWNERNARIFRNTVVLVEVIVARIKEEASLWSMAGTRHLSNIMSRE
ncbi:hypothetical protein CFC21_002813 [Triticum aestivum]|uniref:Uncharacterized protein n=1 Tax=Triticum aestivum TaxID=4565 RepID=A0A3B5Y217_WHEAT|nr:hypothetical protein CFC21_002813 [Triticum aestivum]